MNKSPFLYAIFRYTWSVQDMEKVAIFVIQDCWIFGIFGMSEVSWFIKYRPSFGFIHNPVITIQAKIYARIANHVLQYTSPVCPRNFTSSTFVCNAFHLPLHININLDLSTFFHYALFYISPWSFKIFIIVLLLNFGSFTIQFLCSIQICHKYFLNNSLSFNDFLYFSFIVRFCSFFKTFYLFI